MKEFKSTYVIVLVTVVGLIIFILFSNLSYKQPGKTLTSKELIAEAGDYKIYKSDIRDKQAFEICLGAPLDNNPEISETKALGILLYYGFLDNLKKPLAVDIPKAEVDKEYAALQRERRNSFMILGAEAFNCVNNIFKNSRDDFDKIVLRSHLLEAKIQQAFKSSGIKEDFYTWQTKYLKQNIKILIYDSSLCSRVKDIYGDAWFNSLIVCE